MKVGDLVRYSPRPGLEFSPHSGKAGLIMRVDKDYHGARQALKIYEEIPRGKCVRPNMVDGIGQTEKGIRDRVLVLWSDETGWEYVESIDLEVISD